MNYRGRKLLLIDFVMLILSIIGILDYTFLYIMIPNNFKYIFILFNIIAALVMLEALKSIIYYYRVRKIKKNKKGRVNGNLFYERNRKVKKVIE